MNTTKIVRNITVHLSNRYLFHLVNPFSGKVISKSASYYEMNEIIDNFFPETKKDNIKTELNTNKSVIENPTC